MLDRVKVIRAGRNVVKRCREKRFTGIREFGRRVTVRLEDFGGCVDLIGLDEEIEVRLMAEAGIRAKIGNERKTLQGNGSDSVRAKRVVEPLEFLQHILQPAVIAFLSPLQRITPCGGQAYAGVMRANGF